MNTRRLLRAAAFPLFNLIFAMVVVEIVFVV